MTGSSHGLREGEQAMGMVSQEMKQPEPSLEAGKNQVCLGTRRSTILPANRKVEGNFKTGTMILEHVAQNPEAHPTFSKPAVSHCNGGL